LSPAAKDVESQLTDAAKGDRVALARLLSTVERGGEAARALAALAYREPPPYSIGITGAPGAGKSTLTDRLITTVRAGWPAEGEGDVEPVHQVAVLAVDPSSPFSGGAILGDRVRMQDHATDPSVFIRSMATRGHLGGLALAVPDAVRVLGAVGVPLAIVETVGVGQMEVEVASATDTTVVVVTPGWGDSMQANKAGLLEVADIFVINKADRPGAREARRDLEQMLDLSSVSSLPRDGWRPPVVETVASDGAGVDRLWVEIARHRGHLVAGGVLERARAGRLEQELRRVLVARLLHRVEEIGAGDDYREALQAVVEGRLDPYGASERLLAPVLPPAPPPGGRAGGS
jgi:LAO/AO transport system kinase